MKPHELKSVMERNSVASKTILPATDKTDTPSSCQNILLDDDGILTIFDIHRYGRTFFVENDGIYTVKLGVLHNMDKGALEEATMSCTMPTKTAHELQITAAFDIPGAAAKFKDSVILKAARPFQITLVEGSPILERHNTPLGILVKYESVKTDDAVTLVRTGLRKNVPNQYRAFFDTLSIQIEVRFGE